MERSVTISQQYIDLVGDATVGNYQVECSNVSQVSGNQPIRTGRIRQRDSLLRLQGAVAVTEQNAHRAIAGIRDGQIQYGILVKIPNGDPSGIAANRIGDLRLEETCIAGTQQNTNRSFFMVHHRQIGPAIAVKVPYGDKG